MLNVESTHGMRLSMDDLLLMSALSQQIGIAIGRARLYDEVHQERDFSSAVVDTMSSLVVVLDRQGRIVRFNRACEQTTGYLFDEVRGQKLWDLFLLPDASERLKTLFAQLHEYHFPSSRENVWLTRDGRRRLIAWSSTALLDSAGAPEYIVGTGIDITEHRAAEAALAESELRFRMLVTHAPVGIFQTDTRGDCLFVNDRWLAIAGMSQAEALGKGWVRALHAEDRDRIFAEWYAAANDGREFAMEYRFQHLDGKVVWVAGSAVAISNSAGAISGYFGTVTDITDRKHVERRSLIFASLGRQLATTTSAADATRVIAEVADNLLGWDALY